MKNGKNLNALSPTADQPKPPPLLFYCLIPGHFTLQGSSPWAYLPISNFLSQILLTKGESLVGKELTAWGMKFMFLFTSKTLKNLSASLKNYCDALSVSRLWIYQHGGISEIWMVHLSLLSSPANHTVFHWSHDVDFTVLSSDTAQVCRHFIFSFSLKSFSIFAII